MHKVVLVVLLEGEVLHKQHPVFSVRILSILVVTDWLEDVPAAGLVFYLFCCPR